MNSKATKPIVLGVIFIIALITFSIMTNKVNKDLTTTMDEASLPVMQFVYNDVVINELHAYVEEMDMLSMRDGLVPLDENRGLHLEILTYGNEVDALSYKIRSIDSERLLVEEDNAEAIVSKDKVECNIKLPSIFEQNVEYNMEIALTMGKEKVYYYTRIVQSEDCYVDETLDFAFTFHDYTFREDADQFIPTYMDPATGDATTLNYVDLSCTLRQITWADFTGVKFTEPVASIKEINDSYNVITLNYIMTNVNENDEVEYYNIEEFYRLRQAAGRTYVLNFERTMNQIFRNENDFLLGNAAILLGIRDKDVEYMTNESGDCIAFVQEGDLWCYDRVNNTISQVFSFRSAEGMNSRENWNQHDIRIVRVDEAGTVSFLVYGYMNRGDHEGKVGVGVYHYDGISHNVEEELFISTNKSFGVLQAELGELMYVDEQKVLYLSLNNDIYKIDMNAMEYETLISSSTSECYTASPSGRYLAWVSPEKLYKSTSIHLEDLKTGISHEIEAKKGTYVKPLAFIGEDFVYGVAKKKDAYVDAVGQQTFAMHKIEIMNTSEDKIEVIKTYKPAGKYVGSVTVDDRNIYVKLLKKQTDKFTAAGEDTIMNREMEPANGVELIKSVTELKQTQIAISMKEIADLKKVKIITPKHILVEEDRTLTLSTKNENYYYVYARGKVLLATQNASDAIHVANANYGVVVDSQLRYIFKRARNTMQTAFGELQVQSTDRNASTITKCVSIMLMRENAGLSVSELMEAGQTPVEILERSLSDAVILELSGSSMEELLYFIDNGAPVLAKTGSKRAVLLVGYSASYVYYYDPATGATKGVSYETIEELLEDGGRYFITYVK